MKRSGSFAALAAMILLALVLPFQAAAQTAISPKASRQTTIVTNPNVINRPAIDPRTVIVPEVGSAVISVRDSVGTPVGSAAVSMTVSGQSMTQLTNAQGEATFVNITAGQYSYSVSKAGYYSPIPTMALAISRGGTAASNFILFKYGSAHVKVTSGGIPIAGATVSLSGNGKNLSGTTDTGGFASFGTLNQGSYTLSVAKADYVSVQSTANVLCGQEASVPIAIVKFGSAKVKVTANGVPVSQAFVNVVYGNASISRATDAGGLVSFGNIPPGSYVFKANKTDYIANQTTLSVVGGQEANTTIPITPNVGNLVVTVKDPNFNELVSGAVVTLTFPSGTTRTATTDTQGIAGFNNLLAGTYRVLATKAGYSPLDGNASIGISIYSQPYQLNYRLIKLYTNVIVTVRKQGGQPLLEGVTLSLLGSGVTQTKTTDSLGKAVLTYLQPGDYIVTAGKAGYINTSRDIHIVSSNTITVMNLAIEMPASQ